MRAVSVFCASQRGLEAEHELAAANDLIDDADIMTRRRGGSLRKEWAVVLLVCACGGENDDARGADGGKPEDAGASADAGRHDAGAGGDAGNDAGGDASLDAKDSGSPEDGGPTDAAIDGTAADTGIPNVYSVSLRPEAMVPPCASAGVAAFSEAYVGRWDAPDDWDMISVQLTSRNLSSPITGVHIHYGTAGSNGPTVLSLKAPYSGGELRAMDYLAPPNAPASFEAFKSQFSSGKSYLELHTQKCPNGELRGQVIFP